MNITQAFAEYMDTQGYGTLGTDLFIGGAPLNSPDECWWVVSNGGSTKSKNQTGEKQKNYSMNVYFRSMNQDDVYNRLEEFETDVNRDDCIEIDGYDIIEAEATIYPTDQDLDGEDRTIGIVQITLTVYL